MSLIYECNSRGTFHIYNCGKFCRFLWQMLSKWEQHVWARTNFSSQVCPGWSGSQVCMIAGLISLFYSSWHVVSTICSFIFFFWNIFICELLIFTNKLEFECRVCFAFLCNPETLMRSTLILWMLKVLDKCNWVQLSWNLNGWVEDMKQCIILAEARLFS